VPKFLDKYFSDSQIHKNIYALLVWRFLVLMVLFQICRIAFFLINRGYFPNTTLSGMMRLMGGGAIFDTSAILYTNLLYFLLFLLPFSFRYNQVFQTSMKFLYLISNGLAIVANCCDFIYFQFGFRRTTASIFSEFSHEDNLGALMPKFIVGYWYVVLIGLVLLAILYFTYGPSSIPAPAPKKVRRVKLGLLAGRSIMFVVAAVLIFGGLRGSLNPSTPPVMLSHAGKYIREPLETNIVVNTPFAIYRTISQQTFEKKDYFTDEQELSKVYSPVHYPDSLAQFTPQNVVILILESFGAEYTKSYGKHLDGGLYEGYTPFLDSLINNGRMYLSSYSNGRKSIDAMPSVISSIPMMEEPFLLTTYSKNQITSIASVLDGQGYHTAYFHGAPNGSLGFTTYAQSAGFKEYYGMDNYPDKKDFDGSWGVWDEEFFQYFAGKMNGFPQPFCTAMFSVSSHHPFAVPERYKGKFKKGPMPIHQCINYTDYALRKFFETASKMPWYKNTLFVITGDHTSQSVHLEYKTNIGAFRVPVVFYKPDGSMKAVVDDLAQQIDIMPSVLGYLHYNKPYFAFGRNLFDPREEPFVVTYTTNNYQLVMGDNLLLYNGLTETGFYNIKTDTLLSKNRIGQDPLLEKKMERKIQAFVQQYNNRMVDDRLTVEEK